MKIPVVTIYFRPEGIEVEIENDEGLNARKVQSANRLVWKELQKIRAQQRQKAAQRQSEGTKREESAEVLPGSGINMVEDKQLATEAED